MMVELLRGGVDPLPPCPYLDVDVAQYLNMLLMMNEALAKAATEAHAKAAAVVQAKAAAEAQAKAAVEAESKSKPNVEPKFEPKSKPKLEAGVKRKRKEEPSPSPDELAYLEIIRIGLDVKTRWEFHIYYA